MANFLLYLQNAFVAKFAVNLSSHSLRIHRGGCIRRYFSHSNAKMQKCVEKNSTRYRWRCTQLGETHSFSSNNLRSGVLIQYHGNTTSPTCAREFLETLEFSAGKLRHFTSLLQLKQLYYNLIYPYISYAITSWGSAYTTQIKKIQIKQNHLIRLVFFATLYGPDADSALPLLNLLDLLTVNNIFKLKLLNFTYQWHSKKLPNIFSQHFRYASEVHAYNTRYASKDNLYKARFRTIGYGD